MKDALSLIARFLAFLCFVIFVISDWKPAAPATASTRPNVLGLGLAFWVASEIIR